MNYKYVTKPAEAIEPICKNEDNNYDMRIAAEDISQCLEQIFRCPLDVGQKMQFAADRHSFRNASNNYK
jgi:hypothetical protein